MCAVANVAVSLAWLRALNVCLGFAPVAYLCVGSIVAQHGHIHACVAKHIQIPEPKLVLLTNPILQERTETGLHMMSSRSWATHQSYRVMLILRPVLNS